MIAYANSKRRSDIEIRKPYTVSRWNTHVAIYGNLIRLMTFLSTCKEIIVPEKKETIRGICTRTRKKMRTNNVTYSFKIRKI